MIEYDPDILRTYADQLYRQARHIERKYAMIGGLIGLALSIAVVSSGRALSGGAAKAGEGIVDVLFALLALLVGGYIGYSRGRAKAFWLRFQAQSVLVQAQIEKNTWALLHQRQRAEVEELRQRVDP